MSLIDIGHGNKIRTHIPNLSYYFTVSYYLLTKVLLKSYCHPHESIHFQIHFLPALTPNPATKPSDSLLPLD